MLGLATTSLVSLLAASSVSLAAAGHVWTLGSESHTTCKQVCKDAENKICKDLAWPSSDVILDAVSNQFDPNPCRNGFEKGSALLKHAPHFDAAGKCYHYRSGSCENEKTHANHRLICPCEQFPAQIRNLLGLDPPPVAAAWFPVYAPEPAPAPTPPPPPPANAATFGSRYSSLTAGMSADDIYEVDSAVRSGAPLPYGASEEVEELHTMYSQVGGADKAEIDQANSMMFSGMAAAQASSSYDEYGGGFDEYGDRTSGGGYSSYSGYGGGGGYDEWGDLV